MYRIDFSSFGLTNLDSRQSIRVSVFIIHLHFKMKILLRIIIVPIIFLLLATAKICVAQESSEQTLKLSTELVVLDAQVLHKKTGRVIGNLQKEDFTLYEDSI